MNDVGRDGDEGAGWRCDGLQVGADPESELTLEHVERVRVLPVDVGLGAAFSGLVASPRDVEQLMSQEQPDSSLGLVHDGLALAGR